MLSPPSIKVTNVQAYENDEELEGAKKIIIIKSVEIKQNKTSKQKKKKSKFQPWLSLSMFVTFCPQERNLLKRTNLFDYKPPSGQNFDVCIFLCLVKLDINSSKTCVDGKRKVFFFSTYSKIRIYIYSKFTFSKESYQMMTYIIYILYLPQAILSAGCEI